MTENLVSGILLVLAAGFFQGTFILPMKYTRGWSWENTWLGFSVTAYLVCPWLVALLTVPHLGQVLSHSSTATEVRTLLWGIAWGIGAVTFGLGVDYLGMALGFAIIIGLAAAIGTLVPFLVLSHVNPASAQGMIILAGTGLVLVGVSVCSWAGKLRENASPKDPGTADPSPKKSYVLGVFICMLSGVLSCCGNLAFAFGSEMSTVAIKFGTDPQYASNPLWALLTFPLLICNTVFCAYLFVRERSLPKFLLPGTGRNYLLSISMGAMWLAGFLLYGMAAARLGKMGSSVGWALIMSSMVVVANLWGILTGEWRSAGRKPLQTMIIGLITLIGAMFLVGSGLK